MKNGLIKKYWENGSVCSEENWENGKQHGECKYYDENGSLNLEEDCENGELITSTKKGE